MFETLTESQKARAIAYGQEGNENARAFLIRLTMESLVRIESQQRIDEMAYLKAIEILKALTEHSFRQ